MFLFGDFVFEFLEGLFDVSIHTNTDSTFDAVPVEMPTDELFCFPINFERVLFLV